MTEDKDIKKKCRGGGSGGQPKKTCQLSHGEGYVGDSRKKEKGLNPMFRGKGKEQSPVFLGDPRLCSCMASLNFAKEAVQTYYRQRKLNASKSLRGQPHRSQIRTDSDDHRPGAT